MEENIKDQFIIALTLILDGGLYMKVVVEEINHATSCTSRLYSLSRPTQSRWWEIDEMGAMGGDVVLGAVDVILQIFDRLASVVQDATIE